MGVRLGSGLLLVSQFILGRRFQDLRQALQAQIPPTHLPVVVLFQQHSADQTGHRGIVREDWVNAVDTLLRAKESRQKYGVAGRKAVERTYSLQVQSQVLSRIFNSIPLSKAG